MKTLFLATVTAAALLVTAAADAKPTACGTIAAANGRVPVEIRSGPVSCRTARRVMSRFLPATGRGRQDFRLAGRQWFCADSHGRELTRYHLVAHCTSGSLRVVALRPVRHALRRAPAPQPATPPPTTPAPAPQPTPTPPVGSTRDNPIPLGTSAAVGDWQVTVISVIPDAWNLIHAYDDFNDPPPAGYQDFIARISATYTGTSSSHANGEWPSVGPSAVSYEAWDCGSVPSELPFYTEVFTGGTVTGNVCWQIRAGDAAALTMYHDADFDSARRAFFSLTP